MDPKTLALHGYRANPLTPNSVAAAIQLSTTYEREADGSYPRGFSYGREENPNRSQLEEALAALEGGSAAAAFASGTAATMAVFQTLASGDHALVPREAYYGTRVMLTEIFPRWGLAVDFVDMTDLGAVRAAWRPNTRLVWTETPSNPTMRVTDLEGVAALARERGAFSVCDNTVATPLLQRPFAFGYDLVVHSTTKYLNGHSDVVGGVVIAGAADPLFERVRTLQVHGGAVPSPFDCWLTLRGLKTAPYRIKAQSDNALRIAEFLAGHPRVAAVHYAGLKTHPQHELARRQMTQFGGLLSFEVQGGEREAFAIAAACRLIRRATSLGGVETLIEQRASMEGPGTATPANLLRLSVGLEAVEDLIADLEAALGVVESAPGAHSR
jgi:cystathionine gamma-synthase